jgi:rare lipoprotein A
MRMYRSRSIAARNPRGRSRARSLLALGVLALTIPFGAARANVQEGTVSWYGAQFQHQQTANGERFDMAALTMAHPTLPFGTRVRVTNLGNGRSVVVRVNDRGPFIGHRIADVSRGAAALLGMLNRGVARVRMEALDGDSISLN